jgi:hypothetical protein
MAALFWVFSQDVFFVLYRNGLESGIAAFFIVLLVYKLCEFEISWRNNKQSTTPVLAVADGARVVPRAFGGGPGDEVSKKQIAILAVLAVLTMFSRLDLVFLAVIVGLWVIFRGSPLRFFLPIDIVSIVVITLLAFIMRVDISGYYEEVDVAIAMMALGIIVKVSCAFLFGLYQRSVLSSALELLKRLIFFTLAGSLLTGLLMLVGLQIGIVQGSFSRLVILIDLGLTFLFFGISRFLFFGLQTGEQLHSDSVQKPLDELRAHWKEWISEGALYYGIVVGVLGIYMLWNKLVYGTSSPVSGQIKQWWASLPGRAYGGSSRDHLSFFGLSYVTDENAWRPISRIFGGWAESMHGILPIYDTWRYLLLLTLFAILFCLILFLNRRKSKIALTQLSIIPLLSGAWLQFLYYSTLGYAAHKEWYWVSQLVLTVLTFSLMAGILYTLIRKIPYRHVIAWGLAAYVGISMGTSFWNLIRDMMPYNYWPADTAYMDIVPLLEENTEPGSIIGLTGGGNVGYFIHDRTIINMDGLINSYPYFQALQAHQGGEYLYSIGLDYVLANPVILDQQPYKGQFNAYLEPLRVYYGGKQLMQYRVPQED